VSAVARIGLFVLAVGAVFALATVAGAELNPRLEPEPGGHDDERSTSMDEHAESSDGAGTAPGLAVAERGYRLVPAWSSPPGPGRIELRFRIVGADGRMVRDFDVEHERRMHLILVGRDFTGFQHLHPQQEADGSWHAEAELSRGGVYRVFADFAAEGQSLTLAADLFVGGEIEPRELPAPRAQAPAGDGYTVTLSSSSATEPLRFVVSKDDERLSGVEPYLGADGHLVALREHDQAFLHTHPEDSAAGATIAFRVSYPSAGRYRLFLQFKHGGKVRTAEFTQVVGGAENPPDGDAGDAHEESADGR
jgi:hypothetical protein